MPFFFGVLTAFLALPNFVLLTSEVLFRRAGFGFANSNLSFSSSELRFSFLGYSLAGVWRPDCLRETALLDERFGD